MVAFWLSWYKTREFLNNLPEMVIQDKVEAAMPAVVMPLPSGKGNAAWFNGFPAHSEQDGKTMAVFLLCSSLQFIHVFLPFHRQR
jgi:hypothetical protein